SSHRRRCARSPLLCVFSGSGAHHALPSFPTRRSSDLPAAAALDHAHSDQVRHESVVRAPIARPDRPAEQAATERPGFGRPAVRRSEEHTSELQSRENLVCRLLLEKKKKKNISQEIVTT